MQSSINLIISSALTLLLVTGFSVLTAYRLGPSEFGLFAAMQALAVVLVPLASLRLETRVAVCKTDAELDDLATAITSIGAVFLLLSGAVVLCLWMLGRPIAYGLVALQAVGIVVADFGLARLAFRQLHGPLALYRFLRQFVPVGLALLVAWWFPYHQHAMAAMVFGTWIWALILGWPGFKQGVWQWSVLKVVWRQHQQGLKASVALGGLNGLWLNGLQPLMAWLGWHQLAGQYALLQRLINAPLSVLTVVVNSLLLAKGNDLHERRVLLVQVCVGLALLGMTWSACLWGLLFVQPYWPVPANWLPESDFFYAAAVFAVSSFAVGTVSVVSVRLGDEWFVAGWQLLFMLLWVLALYVSNLNHVFSGLLIMGGLAYGVLLWRWFSLIPTKDV
jgi:hypothetical protein